VDEDVAAIWRLKSDYCWLADDPDPAPMLELFAPDGAYVSQLNGPVTGREAILAQMAASRSLLATTMHVVSNPVVDIGANASTATGRWYFAIHLFGTAPSGVLPLEQIIYGRYHDEFVRLDGRWLFRRLQPVTTGRCVLPPAVGAPPGARGGPPPGGCV
jgi:hypothetical protein